ncbi:unnamed protein product [marine sediment metagenome]|uniref:Uncharacterized protein n=1 Tax=marine sediment metagenome TaxID=412755 RepID=X0THY3_9ZZZZ
MTDTLHEILLCAVFPVCQILGLVAIGLIFRVDRNRKGGA